MAKKGQKFKTWTADEKYNVIKPIIDLEELLDEAKDRIEEKLIIEGEIENV